MLYLNYCTNNPKVVTVTTIFYTHSGHAEAGMNAAGDALGLVTGAGKVATTAANVGAKAAINPAGKQGVKHAVKAGRRAAMKSASKQLTRSAMKSYAKKYFKKKLREQ